MPVNGEPLVRRIIRTLVAQGVSDLVLNLHHRPSSITAAVGDGSDLGARVRYSWEQPVLGSGGGPRHALPLLVTADYADPGRLPTADSAISGGSSAAHYARPLDRETTILLVNGDTLTDVRIAGVLAEHAAFGAAVTMALVPNPRPDKYGGVTVSDEGWVTGFTRRGVRADTYHFIGVQAAEVRVFAALEDGAPTESVSGVYPKLIAADPRSVRAYVSHASFQDIGTPLDYLETSLQLARVEGNRMSMGARTRIPGSAVLARTAVWDDVVIGERARLTECVVCDGAHVPDDATYERCAILAATSALAESGGRVERGLLVQPLDET